MLCQDHPFGPIAVEAQGSQHYHLSELHRSPEEFRQQRYRDRVKARLCRQHGVTLILVPFWKRFEIDQHLRSEFARLGIPHLEK